MARHPNQSDDVLREIDEIGRLKEQGLRRSEIAKKLKMPESRVKRRLAAYAKKQRLDPQIAQRLEARGITDFAGLHSGWLLEKNEDGSGQSLYFHLGPDQEKVDFADAIREVLSDLPKLAPVAPPETPANDRANFLMVADLHVGAHYGHTALEERCNAAIDDLAARLPKAEKAVLVDLGDLLDANDHKGVTPASGNPCDVVRDNHLQNTQTALRILLRMAYRLLETHPSVEIHMVEGNHDTTAYIAVLLALAEHFKDVPQVNVVVTNDDFRVIRWGKCGVFPHHGDKAKWPELKDVWADQFSQDWHECQAERLIATAHFHHDRQRDLVGAEGRHFRTLAAPNKWARNLGLFNRGTLTAITMHKERGIEAETRTNVKFTELAA